MNRLEEIKKELSANEMQITEENKKTIVYLEKEHDGTTTPDDEKEYSKILRELEHLWKVRKTLELEEVVEKSNAYHEEYNRIYSHLKQIVDQYKGKAYGPKTRKKMSAELVAACGWGFQFSGYRGLDPDAEYCDVWRVTDGERDYNFSFVLYGEHSFLTDSKINNFSEKPKILEVSGRCCIFPEYVEDAGLKIDRIKTKFREVKNAWDAYKNAIDAYHAETERVSGLATVGFLTPPDNWIDWREY